MRVDFLQVVVGIIKANQRILIALRNNHQVGGNRWEFPGGKIETLETPEAALGRELQEEIGISVKKARFLETVEHHYPSYAVQLHVFEVVDYEGQPRGMENQLIEWADVETLQKRSFLKANDEIMVLLEKYEILSM